MLPPYTHLWETWKKSSIHSVCPWGQVRVKVLSPNPQLLRLGQLLAKPRGVVPNKNTKAFKLSTRKWNLGVYCFIKPLTIKLKINMNIHSPWYIYNQINLHQKDTKKQLSGASCIYIKYITNYENVKPVALLLVNDWDQCLKESRGQCSSRVLLGVNWSSINEGFGPPWRLILCLETCGEPYRNPNGLTSKAHLKC